MRIHHRTRAAGLFAAIATAASALLAQGVTSPGITEPYLDVTLSAEVPGTVVTRFFEEGDFVKQGQVIIALDKRLQELAVRKARVTMNELKTELEADRKLLKTTKSVSQEEVDKKALDYEQASVDYDTAQEQLHRRQIVSPISGYIASYFLHAGEDCRAQEPLVRVVDTRRCYFVSNVDAKAGHDLKVGQSLKIEIDAGPAPVTVEGKIVFISPVVDPASGLMRVRLLFDNHDEKIRPGVAGKLLFGGDTNGR
jgi:membrane fusion protein, multidrug efflux system